MLSPADKYSTAVVQGITWECGVQLCSFDLKHRTRGTDITEGSHLSYGNKYKYSTLCTHSGLRLISIDFNLNIHNGIPPFSYWDLNQFSPKRWIWFFCGLVSLFHPANLLVVVVHKINLLTKSLQLCPPVILFVRDYGWMYGCKAGESCAFSLAVTVLILSADARRVCTYIFIFLPRLRK